MIAIDVRAKYDFKLNLQPAARQCGSGGGASILAGGPKFKASQPNSQLHSRAAASSINCQEAWPEPVLPQPAVLRCRIGGSTAGDAADKTRRRRTLCGGELCRLLPSIDESSTSVSSPAVASLSSSTDCSSESSSFASSPSGLLSPSSPQRQQRPHQGAAASTSEQQLRLRRLSLPALGLLDSVPELPEAPSDPSEQQQQQLQQHQQQLMFSLQKKKTITPPAQRRVTPPSDRNGRRILLLCPIPEADSAVTGAAVTAAASPV